MLACRSPKAEFGFAVRHKIHGHYGYYGGNSRTGLPRMPRALEETSRRDETAADENYQSDKSNRINYG
jgi:hypothetical protein